MAVAAHTLIASAALTNEPLSEIPVSDIHYTRALNDNGILEAGVQMSDKDVRKLQLVANGAVEPAAVSLYVLRDGAITWGGLLWQTSYDSNTEMLKLTGGEFGTYCAARFLVEQLTYSDDIVTLASRWVNQVFTDGGPPLDINAPSLSGATAAGTFAVHEQHGVLDLLQAYAAMGLDWSFDTEYDSNGNPSALLSLSSPRRGVAWNGQGSIFDFPGAVMQYTADKSADPTKFTSDLFVSGAGSGTTQLQVEFPSPAPGYVKLQMTANNSNLTSLVQVKAYGAGVLAARSGSPPYLFNVTVRGDAFFSSGLTTGDEFGLVINDPYLDGIFPQRIIAYDVQPQTASTPEQVVMTISSIAGIPT